MIRTNPRKTAEWLRFVMKSCDISVIDLAKELGVGEGRVRKWLFAEKGMRKVDLMAIVYVVERYFELDFEDFVYLEKNQNTPSEYLKRTTVRELFNELCEEEKYNGN